MKRRKGSGLGTEYSITTMSVTLVLLLIGVVGYLIINAYWSGTALRNELRFTLMLTREATPQQRTAIESYMRTAPQIESWSYISPDMAAGELREYLDTDFEKFLGENPLPGAYELKLNPQVTEQRELTALERTCASWAGVEQVVYQQKIVESIFRNLARLNWILAGFGALLLLITLMLISNTMRLAVAARRTEIATMKLVGATRSFIRRPFVLRSFTQGVVAGVLASGLLYLFVDALTDVMPDAGLLFDLYTLGMIFSCMILLGVAICTTFTTLAVNRYIGLDSPI